jgi:hypothetical protein
MNCDICGRQMYESRVGWWCNAHRLRMSCVEDRRMRERGTSAMIAFICGLTIAIAIIGSLLARGCQPAPAVADCLCEQCGEIIGAADHGRCDLTRSHGGTEVAACK